MNVAESTTDLPSWCSQRQSGQKTKLHLDELHSARDDDTRDGDVHSGQWVNLSPGIQAFTRGNKFTNQSMIKKFTEQHHWH